MEIEGNISKTQKITLLKHYSAICTRDVSPANSRIFSIPNFRILETLFINMKLKTKNEMTKRPGSRDLHP